MPTTSSKHRYRRRPKEVLKGAEDEKEVEQTLLMRSQGAARHSWDQPMGGLVAVRRARARCSAKSAQVVGDQCSLLLETRLVFTPEDSGDARPAEANLAVSGVLRFRSRPHFPPPMWRFTIYLFPSPATMPPSIQFQTPEVPRPFRSIPQKPHRLLAPCFARGYVHTISSRILYIESFPRK
jgi:hypothetical protein